MTPETASFSTGPDEIPAYRRPADLPDFKNPPVSEVVLSVRFEPLSLEFVRLVVAAQELFSADLPNPSQQPRLEMPIEDLSGLPVESIPRFELVDTMPSPRLWCMSDSGDELVQLQDDFFARNWRRSDGSDAVYPHFEAVRSPFVHGLQELQARLGGAEGLPIIPVQCEVTYVNTITGSGDRKIHSTLNRVLRIVGSMGDGFLPAAEGVQVSSQHLMRLDGGGEPFGRLHISAQPAFRRSDKYPVVILTLTARGPAVGRGLGGVVSFLDLGHEWIVRSFAEITTDEMHAIWGRTDGR